MGHNRITEIERIFTEKSHKHGIVLKYGIDKKSYGTVSAAP
jgi:hypothetical protein